MTDSTLHTRGEQSEQAEGQHGLLLGYLYDELDAADRSRFEEHLASCAECRVELEAMRDVRGQLGAWQLPEDAGVGAGGAVLSAGRDLPAPASRPWWAPAALAAAAVILLAVGAAIANLEIRYGREGITVRTGWAPTASVAPTTAAAAPSQPSEASEAPAAEAPGAQAQPVSAEDLAALETRLRTEFHALPQSAPAPSQKASVSGEGRVAADPQLLQRVRELIEQSETRQRRELALRVAQVVRDFDAQRRTDLVRIQQGLGQIEGSTAADRQLLNYLVRVSQGGRQ